jgi:transcriptional regulator with XRE-family HTH domain
MKKQMKYTNIARRLEQVRDNSKLTRTEFQKELSIKQAAYSKYSNSKNPRTILSLPTKVLIKLRNFFNVDLNWLITGNGCDPEVALIPLGEWGIEGIPEIETFIEQKKIPVPKSLIKNYPVNVLKAIYIKDYYLCENGLGQGDIVIIGPPEKKHPYFLGAICIEDKLTIRYIEMSYDGKIKYGNKSYMSNHGTFSDIKGVVVTVLHIC